MPVAAGGWAADALLVDVLGTISSTCLRNREKHPGRRCRAYLPDLLDPQPPDLPAAMRKRLRVIKQLPSAYWESSIGRRWSRDEVAPIT